MNKSRKPRQTTKSPKRRTTARRVPRKRSPKLKPILPRILAALTLKRIMVGASLLTSVLVISAMVIIILDGRSDDPISQRETIQFEEQGYPEDVTAVIEGLRGRKIIDFSALDDILPIDGPPAWQENAISFQATGKAKLVIVIDDMGMVLEADRRLAKLPAPLTLAYLPYSPDLRAQTQRALKAGHELMVHMPMEPMRRTADPGPEALLLSLDLEEFDRRLEHNLSVFDGYVGVNNHMGSKLTADAARMVRVMAALKRRGLLFLDSLTSGRTVGPEAARAGEVPFLTRDIFLDNDRIRSKIRTQFQKAVAVAKRNGTAIAIGHPYRSTLDVLAEEIPKLERQGVELAPISAVMRLKEQETRSKPARAAQAE